jgi:uncharacterized protein YdaU (DUF1376 family)
VSGDKPKTLAMMPFYPRDYIAATRGMTLAERGAYCDLLFVAWDSGKPLPKETDVLARLVGVTPRTFAAIWPAIRKKLVEVPDGYISERLELERRKSLALRSKASEKAAAAAAARWHAPSNTRSNAPSMPTPVNAVLGAMLEDCPPSPSPSPTKDPNSEDAASRMRARPAIPTGPRSRPNGEIDESSEEVRRRRKQAADI